jgi:hypothetical protein
MGDVSADESLGRNVSGDENVNLEAFAVHEESALVTLFDERGNDLEQIAADAVVGDLAGLPVNHQTPLILPSSTFPIVCACMNTTSGMSG